MKGAGMIAQLLFLCCSIFICRAQNTAPFFDLSNYGFDTPENSLIGTSVGRVTATDNEGDELIYSIASNTADSRFFNMNSSTGEISIRTPIDRESVISEILRFVVAVSDQSETRTINVAVTVVDVNDNAPVFTNLPRSLPVNENSNVGTSVYQPRARDADLSRNSDILFSLVPNDTFSIDPSSGDITQDVSLDFDVQPRQYTLTVIAQDRALNNPMRTAGTLTIDVGDINDLPPQFSQNIYLVQIHENFTMGSSIVTVDAVDQDEGIDDIIFYDITDGNLQINGTPSFSINESTGFIYVNVPMLDREEHPIYMLTVTARESMSSTFTRTALVDITILDINDHIPVFDMQSYEVNVSESTQVNTSIITLVARDRDEGVHATFRFTIVNVTDGDLPFAVTAETVQNSGEADITLTEELDFETQTSYRFVVMATETLQGMAQSSYALVTVYVGNENDNGPYFVVEVPTTSIAENSVDSFIAVVSAMDDDAGELGQVTFRLSDDDIGKPFEVNTTAGGFGRIRTTRPLDFEMVEAYMLTVVVEDLADPPRTSETSINVTVLNINDHPPIFIGDGGIPVDTLSLRVLEETPFPFTLLALQASDRDGTLTELTFTIVSDTPPFGHFQIDGGSGMEVLNTNIILDFDLAIAVQYYTLNISVNDTEFLDFLTVNIELVDINDNSPIFANDSYSFDVVEHSEIDTLVGEVQAMDIDSGTFGEIEYILYGPAEVIDYFRINSTTGAIYVMTDIDREVTPGPLQFNVIASDLDRNISQRNTDNTSVTITVLDINDNVPIFSEDLYVFSVPENTIQLPAGFNVSATDRDLGSNGMIVYTIIGGNEEDTFVLDPYSGVLTRNISSSLDFERTRGYMLNVSAEDMGEPGNATIVEVVIEIIDLNDNGPMFSRQDFNASIFEDTPPDFSVIRLTATDADSGEFGRVMYTVSDVQGPIPPIASANGTFVIGPTTGIVRTEGQFDRELFPGPYVVTVTASDGGTPPNNVTTTLEITILDTNDEAPVFVLEVVMPPDEEQVEGIVVGLFQATDGDEMDTANSFITYSIADISPIPASVGMSVRAMEHFALNTSSDVVQLLTNTSLDYELIRYYDITIRAQDNGVPSLASETTVRLAVVDINDNAPQFAFDVNTSRYTAEIFENSPASIILELMATDEDSTSNGMITFVRSGGFPDPPFSISGVDLLLTGALDFESVDSYLFNVSAVDAGSPAMSNRAQVEITILDVNDNSPIFSPNNEYVADIDEGDYTLNSSLVALVNASDIDSGEFGDVSYEVFPANSLFSVYKLAGGEGAVSVNGVLDRETLDTYSITILARDGANPPNTATATVAISVNDVNDNPPVLNEQRYMATILEGELPSQVANILRGLDIQATDADLDRNSEVYFFLANTTDFDIDVITGVVRSLRVFDYEVQQSFDLEVVVMDNTTDPFNDTAQLTIYIEDINDNAPFFIDFPSNVTYAEDIEVGSSIANITAGDRDSGINQEVVFQLANDEGKFSIDGEGRVTLLDTLDRESRPSYNLTVTVSDRGQRPLSTTGYLFIEVTDVNDERPRLDRTSYTFVVPEDVDLNTTLGMLTAVDMDEDINGEVLFEIVSGDTDRFALVTMQVDSVQTFSAMIINNMLFDYENVTSYSLTVRVRNVVPPYFITLADVTIAIRDTNDNAPAFSMPGGFTLTVPEAAATQRPVGTVVATDEDGGLNGTVNYLLAPNTEQLVINTFSVNLENGVITLISPLNFEILNKYIFFVEAFDLSAVPLTSNVSVTVNVEDTNENAPQFDMQSYSASLEENLPAGTLVTRVNATETETGGASVRYALETGETDQFQIDAVTGIITLRASLDREMRSSYVLTVEATDIASNPDNPLSTFVQVAVEVLDDNDNTPDFGVTAVPEVNIPESSAVGVRLPDVFLATDEDDDSNAAIRYSITPEFFAVDENTGVISVRDSSVLDRETTPVITLRLTATDGGTNPRAVTLTIQVSLDDINDNTPVFMPAVYTASVAEGSDVGVSVTMVTAIDADIEPALRYAIMSGDDDADNKFQIDEVTGLIETSANALDRETRANYVLIVSVTDSGSPQRMSTATVTITVLDVNDNTPLCDQPTFAFSTEEDNNLQIELGSVTATDGDNVPGLLPVGSGQLRYELASPNVQGVVTVTPGGVIFGEPGLDFDILVDGTFTFDVLVSDQPADASRLRSAMCRVMVTLSDENDNVPEFDISLYESTISEDAMIGNTVAVVRALDRDSGTNGDFTYSIQSSISVFSIDPSSGVVTVAGSLDSDVNNLYELDIEARDNGIPSNTGVTILRIAITDIDDDSPRFDRSFYQQQISEDAALLTTVATVIATDRSSGLIRYAFDSGNDDGRFFIAILTGSVQVIDVLDRETSPVYNLVIRATDNVGNVGTTLLRVDILDVNDEAPQFEQIEYSAFVNENSLEGTLVLPVLSGSSVRILAVDADEPNSLNSVVQYSLAGFNADRFNIEASTGRVTVARSAMLNYEVEPVVPVTVVASDSNPTLPMSSSVTLYVNLVDVNDEVPRFSSPFGYIVLVDEDRQVGDVIATVTATDRDSVGGMVRYRLTNAVPFSAISQFSINRTNGQLSLLQSLDRETDPIITLVATASDMGEPALSSVVNVRVTVRDVNDNPPEFDQDSFTTTVPEFLAVGGVALQVTAVDPDGPGLNSDVVYDLVGTQSTFTINPTTGVITTIAALDFEAVQFHSFMVMACDRGTPVECSMTRVRINVGDFNDQIPTFDQMDYLTDVCFESAVNGMPLVQPVAVDGDSGINAVLAYSLTNNPSIFAIDSSTGRISFAQEPSSTDVDRHVFTIIAEDMGDTRLSSSAQVTIQVLNCTEQDFYFAAPFHYFEIFEGDNRFTDGSGSLAIMLSRVAQDVSFSPALPTNPFTNVLNVIQLKPFNDLLEDLRQVEGLDREARSLYTVILRAQDSLSTDTFTSVTLQVLDTNDNSPVFSSDLEVFLVPENQTAPLEIGSVIATDVDEGTNAELEYRVLSTTPISNPPIFSIDVSTGVISTETELDRESEEQYELTIQATDGVGSDTIAVRVTVQDINDCQPMFVEEEYRVAISENLPSGSSVASVRATDCDEGANAVLRYSITSGDVGIFELDLISGVITTLVPLDFETTPRYFLRIAATDMGVPTPLTGYVDVFFTVVDFNDCPPEFVNALPTPPMPVFEDAAVNSVIQTYTVQDCDSGSNGVNGTRFSIIAGNEEGKFEINAITGVLRTVASLDREEQDVYILNIQAIDSAGVNSLSSDTELTVTVMDVNDNAPVLDEDVISITVTEGEGLRQTLLTLTATDADSGTNGQILYALVGGDDTFVIDERTGELSLAQTLDREANDSYVLSVVAGNRGAQPLFSNATVIIVAVSDENDNDPEILNIVSGVTRVEVPENTPSGTPIFTVNATDRDIGPNANIRLSLDDMSNSLPFILVGETIRVNDAAGILDFEQRIIYSLVVVAEDRGIPNSRQGIATLIVEVTDMNDSPPVFIEDNYIGMQAEDTAVDSEVLRVQATDADSNMENSLIAYSLDSSPDADFFNIDNMTGIIYNALILDREVRDSYSFGVIADNYLSSVIQTGTAQVTINILDINDEAPVFGQRLYTATVLERTPTNSVVLVVTASDDDTQNTPNSDLIFSLGRVTNVPFFINPNSGILIVQNELDFEDETSYDFDVVVEDKGTMPLRDTATIRITIGDVNDQVPVFSLPVYTSRLPENSPAQQIQALRFVDGDTESDHTQSTLSIVSVSPQANGLFSISAGASGTGTISINEPVDYEMEEAYSLTVMVMNNNLGVGEACQPQTRCTLSSTTTVQVEIIDSNDNIPVFSRGPYEGEISSTALTGTSILAVTATDGDSTAAFRSIRYRLGSSSANSPFRISETTGTIFTRGSFEGLDGDMYTLDVFAVDNDGTAPFNEAMTTVDLIVLNDFQRIAIIFNISVDVISGKEPEIIGLLEELTGYDIFVEQYREYSTDTMTSFIFHAMDNGNIIDFDEFLTGSLENELFIRLEQCRIIRIQSFGDLIVSQGPVDTEIIVILVLCLFLIIGAILFLITAFSQRYLALHAARHKLLADVFYGSHAGSSIVENIHQENIQLQLLETSGQAMNKQNPMFVHPYDNWAGVDTSGVESVGGDSNLQKDNPMYESQEIRMEMFADVSDEDDDEDEADEAELLAAALQEDSDVEDEDNSVTAI